VEKLILAYQTRPDEQLQTDALLVHLGESIVPYVHGLTAHVRNLGLPREFLASGAFDSRVAFALSVWVDSYERRSALQNGLDAFGVPTAAYAVTESVAREYPRINWRPGTKSPGVTLFAQFRRRAGIGREDFYQLWQEHSHLSLHLHPLTRYHRNFVQRRLSADGPDWDAIVEERVERIDDLLPEHFYPDEAARVVAVQDLDRFVDLTQDDMRCALLEEYIVKKPPWLSGI
jgi:hypothetical protein